MAGCILWLWGIPGELAGGIAPLSHPYKEHPAAPSAPPQFTAAGNHRSIFPFLLAGEGEEQLVHWGAEGAVEPFVTLVLQCLTMGQVSRVVPGYQELSFLSVKKRKELRPPMREDAFSELFCCGLLHLTGLHIYQMINVN